MEWEKCGGEGGGLEGGEVGGVDVVRAVRVGEDEGEDEGVVAVDMMDVDAERVVGWMLERWMLFLVVVLMC